MRLWRFVASELATNGSVIAKHERISPSSSGPQELLLLQRRAELGEDLHVAGVGRGAVRGLAQQRVATHDLAQRCVLDVGEARRPLRVREEEVPETSPARLGLQLLHDRRVEVRVAGLLDLAPVDGNRGCEPLVDEGLQLIAELQGAW